VDAVGGQRVGGDGDRLVQDGGDSSSWTVEGEVPVRLIGLAVRSIILEAYQEVA